MATTTILIEKSIRFNRKSRDYDCYLCYDDADHFIGSAATYSQGEDLCNSEYYELLEHGLVGRDYDLTPEEAAEVAPVVEALNEALPVAAAAPALDVLYQIHYTLGALSRHLEALPACEAFALLDVFTALAQQSAAPVRVETMLCADKVTPELIGTPIGTRFLCGAGDDEVEVFVDVNGYPPEVFAFGRDPLPLEEVLRVLPNLLRVVNDPRIQQAYERMQVAA